MPLTRCSTATALLFAALLLASSLHAQEAPDTTAGPETSPQTSHTPAPIERTAPPAPTQLHEAFPAPPPYDPAIFGRLIPPAELRPLLQADGATVADVFHDRATRRLLLSAIPNDIFRYGRDLSLPDAIAMQLDQSPATARLRDNRYLLLTGDDRAHTWLRHDARTLLWIDTQEGIILGAFFFHPTNGEPGPTVTVFSNQIKQDDIHFSELPPAFLADLEQWQQHSGVPPALITYFIGDIRKKFLLEHDLDLCTTGDLTSGSDCEQLNADAADNDLTASLYLQQVNYATNATAYMIRDPDQITWITYRDRTCLNAADPLACRIHLTRQRIAIVHPPIRRR
jgi:hypothetical protein